MILNPGTIQPAKGSRKAKRIIGRGDASNRGSYSCRGMKGQRARSGGKSGLKLKGFKTVLQSTPKLRGFHSQFIRPVVVLLRDLEKCFNDGDTVNVIALKEKKLLRKNENTAKIVVKGTLTKKLTINGVQTTKTAKALIEKVGGSIK